MRKNIHGLQLAGITYIYIYIYFIHLAVLSLGCNMWDLVPWPGIELGSPALGVPNVSH